MRKLLLTSIMALATASSALGASIVVNGVPVKHLYVDGDGRLYLSAGPGRKPVRIESSTAGGTGVFTKDKKIKLGGTAFIQYKADLKNPNHKNSFNITRNYVELKGYFNDKDYFRTTYDITDEKGNTLARLKYAYVYFADVLPYTGVEVGLGHRPWVDWEEHHGWLHREVEPTFIEGQTHLISSADKGLDFKGKHGIASWQFGIFNGEGYHADDSSDHFGKSLEGRLSLTPIKGFTLSGNTAHSFDHKGGKYDRHVYQLHMVYDNPYALLAGQYVWDKDDYYHGSDIDKKGYSLNADLKLKALANVPVTVFGRYDYFDPDTDKGDNENKHYVFGTSYDLSRHVKFTLANDRLLGKSKKDSNTIYAVTKVNW